MRKIKYVILFIFVVFLCGCSNNIFATSIAVSGLNDSYFVGDEVNLDNINIEVNPTNTTQKPEIEVSDVSKIMVENTKLKFISSGECDVIFKVKKNAKEYITYTKTINIKNITYVSSLTFDKNNIVVNMPDVAYNNLIINPTTSNQVVEISYSNANVINYDYHLGIITPLNQGSTVVTATANKNKAEIISASFLCSVTKNVYATSLSSKIANLNNVVLKVGEQSTISTTVMPQNYNMGLEYVCSNSLVEILPNGTVVVGDSEGEGVITVKAKSQTGYITQNINFKIINPQSALDVDLFYNNNIATKIYSGITYRARVNNQNIDYSKVKFLGCSSSYSSNNWFNIIFNECGAVNFMAEYNYNFSINNQVIKYQNSLTVYRPISDVNFGLFCFSRELVATSLGYTLNLIDESFKTEADNNGIYSSATIVASPKGTFVYPSDLSISVTGSAITLNNNVVCAANVGTAKIVVSSCDPLGFTTSFNVTVNEIKVSAINVSNSNISLDLDDNYTQALTYEVVPNYAYNKNVEVTKSNNNINISNMVISAESAGSCEISLKNGTVTKTINVTVAPSPNQIVAQINNSNVENNSTKTLELGANVLVKAELFYNNVKIEKVIQFSVSGGINVIAESGAFKVTATSKSNGIVRFYYKNLSVTINFEITEENKVVSACFEEKTLQVNSFYTNQLTPSILYTFKDSSALGDTSNVSLISLNTNVATVNGTSLTICGLGNATIKLLVDGVAVDELTLSVFNKEIVEINSVAQLKNLQNKSYVLTQNLNLQNFETIDSFSGELDFADFTLSGLRVPLFNTLNVGAKLTNLNFSGNINLNLNSTPNYCVVANINNGTIENVTFSNLTVSVNNVQSSSVVFLSLICVNNNGTISGVNFNNVSVYETRTASTSLSRFNGICFVNTNSITNVCGKLNITNYVKVSGICETLSGEITNVALELNIVTPNKFIGAGVAYDVPASNTLPVNISDITLTLVLSGNTNINAFGGLIKSANSDCQIADVNLTFSLMETYPTTKFAVYFVDVAEVNVQINNHTNAGADNFDLVINGNLNFN